METVVGTDTVVENDFEQLQFEHFKLTTALELSGTGHWYWLPTTGTIFWSKTTYAILGLKPDNQPKRVDDFLSFVVEDDIPQALETIKKAIEDGETPDLEYRIRRHDGQIRYLHARAKVVRSPTNENAVIGIVRDVTTQKRQEQELQKSKLEAERLSDQKSEFLSNMTHELRTPLNSILGFAQLMESESLSQTQHENIVEIIRSGKHLLNLISDILDLSRLDVAKLSIRSETVDISFVIEECLSLVAPLAEKNKIALHFSATNAPNVVGDELRIKQVILNLMSNAIKYNKPNGDVWVTVKNLSPFRVRIEFRDSGIGIRPENMPKLFMPFERFEHRAGPIEGTGIGLTICKRYIELMGGTIGAESEYGIGSCLWIDIPTTLN